MTDDRGLLQQYSEHSSETAFTELVRRYLGLVYHAAFRQLDGDSAAARDVAQEVFILLARQARSIRHHPALIGWLYQTTHFKAAEALRQQQRRKAREMETHAREERDRVDMRWQEIRPELDSAIMRLGDKDRAAVVLRYFNGSSIAEISLALDLSEDAVQKRLERSLGKLRKILAGSQITSTATAIAAALATQTALAAPVGFEGVVAGLALGSVTGAGPGVGLALFLMSKFKIVAGCLVLAAVIGGGYLDHVRQRAQISSLQRLVLNLERKMTAVGASTNSSSGPISAKSRGHTSAPASRNSLADDLAARGTIMRDFKNAGQKSPRSAFETLKWASARGKVDEIAKVIAVDAVSRQKLEAMLDSLPPSMREEFPDAKSIPATMFALEGLVKNSAVWAFQVENETTQPDGTVRFDFANIGGGVPVEKTDYFQDSPTGWQIMLPPEAIDRLSTVMSDPMVLKAILTGGKLKGMPPLDIRK